MTRSIQLQSCLLRMIWNFKFKNASNLRFVLSRVFSAADNTVKLNKNPHIVVDSSSVLNVRTK